MPTSQYEQSLLSRYPYVDYITVSWATTATACTSQGSLEKHHYERVVSRIVSPMTGKRIYGEHNCRADILAFFEKLKLLRFSRAWLVLQYSHYFTATTLVHMAHGRDQTSPAHHTASSTWSTD